MPPIVGFFRSFQIGQQGLFADCPDRTKFMGNHLPRSNNDAQIFGMITAHFRRLLDCQPFVISHYLRSNRELYLSFTARDTPSVLNFQSRQTMQASNHYHSLFIAVYNSLLFCSWLTNLLFQFWIHRFRLFIRSLPAQSNFSTILCDCPEHQSQGNAICIQWRSVFQDQSSSIFIFIFIIIMTFLPLQSMLYFPTVLQGESQV